MNRSRHWLDWAVLVTLVVVWGSAFAGLKIAVADWPPAAVASARLSVAAGVLWVLLQLRRERLPRLRPRPEPTWWTYGLLGVFGLGLPFLCFSWAAGELSSAVLAICNGTSPVFTALFAHQFIAAERLTRRKAIGVSLGLVGFVALVAPDLAASGGVAAGGLAELVALAGAALYAVGNVVTKRAPPLGAVPAAFIMCLFGALATALAAAGWTGNPGPLTARAALAIVLLGLVPTALGTLGYLWLIRRRGALFTSFTTYLAPIWAILIGVVLLAERPGPAEYLALALILAGVGVANLPGKTVDRPPRPREDGAPRPGEGAA